MSSTRYEVEAAATHEAGHALAYLFGGVELASVAVDRAHAGHGVTVPSPGQLFGPLDLWRTVGVAVAGVAAEYPGDPDTALAALAMQPDDLDQATQGAELWLEHADVAAGSDELIGLVLAAVCALFERPHVARALERITTAVLVHGALTGPQTAQAARCGRWRVRPGRVLAPVFAGLQAPGKAA